MSDEVILYHYDSSPFSEKVRLALGLKKLHWRSVHIPPMPPRPLLESLTGGYRRTPVMQIGADIYCDSHLILRTLDRLRPDSAPLFSNCTTQPLCWWWDKATFGPVVALWVGLHGDSIPEKFLEDRKKFAPHFNFSKEGNEKDVPLNVQRIRVHLRWIIDLLADGRSFLQGEPSAFDVTVYHTLWFAKRTCANEIEQLLPELFESKIVSSWYDRVTALGHGVVEEMTAEQAFDIANQAEPVVTPSYISNDPSNKWSIGERLCVTPNDTGRVPVEGTLVAADNYEIVLRLSSEQAGNINVHFPRAGFDVTKTE